MTRARIEWGVAAAAAVAVVAVIGVAVAVPRFTPFAEAIPGGGYDRSVYESVGPELTAVGMRQSFSGDGRYTVFESDEKLTADAVGNTRHVYRRTVADGSIVLVSKRVRTAEGGSSYGASISADGNWVAFETTDPGVFAEDFLPAGSRQIALVDMSTGAVTRVSTPRGGAPAADAVGDNTEAMVSADGSHVVFTSTQAGMSDQGAPTTSVATVESFDRSTGTITNVSTGSDAATGVRATANGPSGQGVVSADGRYIAYTSAALNLPVAATRSSSTPDPAVTQVYRWDSTTGATVLVSAGAADTATGATTTDDVSYRPSISADGRTIGFISAATNLLKTGEIAKTANHMTDAYVRDVTAGTTHRVSLTLIDQGHPDVPDSAGRTPSTTRSRGWFQAGISTTRINLAADGRSAVLTTMASLLAVEGACVGCQKFSDDNGAMDVYQVRWGADGLPVSMQPISVKRTNQDPEQLYVMLRDSTTPGGDSMAEGVTPATTDGALVAFSSQAGDLRGFSSIEQIQGSGPPNHYSDEYLPIYFDGGEPNAYGEPVRTFTARSNSFNAHLHLVPSVQASLATDSDHFLGYEARNSLLQQFDEAPASTFVASAFSKASVAAGGTLGADVTVTALSRGYVELTVDLEGLAIDVDTALPAGWVREKESTLQTVTYTTKLMEAGAVATLPLRLEQYSSDAAASRGALIVTANNELPSSIAAEIPVRPDAPACAHPEVSTIVAGAERELFAVQCIAPVAMAATAAHGSVTLGTSGTVRYQPGPGYRGADTITVIATDAAGRRSAPVQIVVSVVEPYSASDDSYQVESGHTLTVAAEAGPLADDARPQGTVAEDWRIQRGWAPQHGTLTMDDATGAFTFVPDAGFVGDASFRYRVGGVGIFDGTESNIATVTIHVTAGGE